MGFTLKWSGSWCAQLLALLLGVPAAAECLAPDLVHLVPVALARAVRDEFHAADLQVHDAEVPVLARAGTELPADLCYT